MADVAKTFSQALVALNGRRPEARRKLVSARPSKRPLECSRVEFARRRSDVRGALCGSGALDREGDSDRPCLLRIFHQLRNRVETSEQAATGVDNFAKAVSLNPNEAEAWTNRGSALNDLGEHDAALADFDKAISLNRAFSEALVQKGKTLRILGRYHEALFAFDQALSTKPDLAEGWFGRGHVLYDLKNYDLALASFDRVMALKPDLSDVEGNGFIRKCGCANGRGLSRKSLAF